MPRDEHGSHLDAVASSPVLTQAYGSESSWYAQNEGHYEEWVCVGILEYWKCRLPATELQFHALLPYPCRGPKGKEGYFVWVSSHLHGTIHVQPARSTEFPGAYPVRKEPTPDIDMDFTRDVHELATYRSFLAWVGHLLVKEHQDCLRIVVTTWTKEEDSDE